jgi:hypothetical protein
MPVLMNATVRRALAPPAERSAAPSTIGETNVFGRQYAIPLNSAILPTVNTHGDFDEMCLAANAGFVRKIELAAEIVPDIMDGAAAAISISEQHSRTIHILVVEDDPIMRNMVVNYLEDHQRPGSATARRDRGRSQRYRSV